MPRYINSPKPDSERQSIYTCNTFDKSGVPFLIKHRQENDDRIPFL